MKLYPHYEIVPLQQKSVFLYRAFNYDLFDVDLHSHNEYELTLIEEGCGKRIIGNEISYFKSMDLVLIAPNVPHLYRGEENPQGIPDGGSCHVIQINPVFFDSSFFDFSELHQLKNTYEFNSGGLKYAESIAKHILPLIKTLNSAVGCIKVTVFLEILNHLSSSPETIPISQKSKLLDNEDEENRAKRIYRYILNNYMNDIKLDAVAEIAGMSKSGFCNYFKKRTEKNFSDFVNQLRIQKVCTLLLESDDTISRIAYQVGFNNLSYFNRAFRKLIKCSPYEYRKRKK